MLNATLPRIFQRRILRMLPPELGRYLLDAGRDFSTHGEIGVAPVPSSHSPTCRIRYRNQCYTSSSLL